MCDRHADLLDWSLRVIELSEYRYITELSKRANFHRSGRVAKPMPETSSARAIPENKPVNVYFADFKLCLRVLTWIVDPGVVQRDRS
jgi:hypothetical protein